MERVHQKELEVEELEDSKIPDQASDFESILVASPPRRSREMAEQPVAPRSGSGHRTRKDNVSQNKGESKGPNRNDATPVASRNLSNQMRKGNRMMKALSSPVKTPVKAPAAEQDAGLDTR